MFVFQNVPDTKRNRIAATIAIVLGLIVGFYIAVSSGKDKRTDQASTQESSVAATIPTDMAQSPELPATLPAATVDDIDFTAYSKDLANGFGLEMGETRLDSIDKIRLYFAPEPGVNMVNLTSSTFELDDGAVMLFARHDLPDDSVFSEEIYAVFSGEGEANKFNQTLEAYGLRVKCRRGDKAMEWTIEICP